MSISLKYLLERNKTNLRTFLISNDINSYSALLDYCKAKGCSPVDEEAFNACLPPKVLPPVEIKVPLKNEKSAPEKKKSTPRRATTTSKTRRKKSTRRADSKVSDT